MSKPNIDDLWMCYSCGECPRQPDVTCPSCGSGIGISNIGTKPSRGLRPPRGNYDSVRRMVMCGFSKEELTKECIKIIDKSMYDYY